MDLMDAANLLGDLGDFVGAELLATFLAPRRLLAPRNGKCHRWPRTALHDRSRSANLASFHAINSLSTHATARLP